MTNTQYSACSRLDMALRRESLCINIQRAYRLEIQDQIIKRSHKMINIRWNQLPTHSPTRPINDLTMVARTIRSSGRATLISTVEEACLPEYSAACLHRHRAGCRPLISSRRAECAGGWCGLSILGIRVGRLVLRRLAGNVDIFRALFRSSDRGLRLALEAAGSTRHGHSGELDRHYQGASLLAVLGMPMVSLQLTFHQVTHKSLLHLRF